MLGGCARDEIHQVVASEMPQEAYGQLSVEHQQLSSVGPASEPGLAGGLSSVKCNCPKNLYIHVHLQIGTLVTCSSSNDHTHIGIFPQASKDAKKHKWDKGFAVIT